MDPNLVRLRIWHKLLLSGLSFALPTAVLFYWAVAGIPSAALRTVALILSLASLAFAAGLLFLTGRNLGRTLARATAVAGEIADGRLSEAQRLLAREQERKDVSAGQAKDETRALLEAFRAMTVNLSALLKQLRQAGAEVGGSSVQIAASVKQLETTVVEQAASTNEVTATSRQIFATVQELAGTMRAVQQLASQAASLASGGIDSLKGINTTMSELLEATAAVSNALNGISQKAAAINQVITAITNVANRTNLISLNAAIEAEKAGEHAAGFSVVALEIRRLADQTAVAALDIEKMISEMQAAVKDVVGGMAHYAERARSSTQTVAGITSDLGRVIEYTRNLEPRFETVNTGMQMQSQAAGQILEAMQQLAETAGQTRDSLAQFRNLADQMRAAAQLLQSEVGRFSIGA